MNTVVVGLDYRFIRNVIIELDEEKTIDVKGWFINEETFSEGIKLKNSIHWRNIIYGKGEYEYRYDIPDDLYNLVSSRFNRYLDHLVRESYFENRTVPENISVLNIFMHYFYDLLFGKKVELIIFGDAPHGAYAFLLYDIAKFLHIKTLILFPFYMIDKFIACWGLDDIGYYKNSVNLTNIDNSQLANDVIGQHEKNVWWDPPKKRTLNNVLYGCIDRFRDSINEFNYKYDNFYDYVSRHVSRSVIRGYRKYLFKKNNAKLFNKKIDDRDKFVYFPLHLQPESSTSALGKEYFDQILAIERVLRIIPEDWFVYIKENPRQTYLWRDKYFYARLGSMKRVKCVEGSTNTYDLIKKSQFVAVISGTAGFEAISGGKPALVFGLAWYRSLPGVTVYNPGTTISDILKPFSIEDVKNSFKNIEKYIVDAIVFDANFYRLNINNNIDINRNQTKVYHFLKRAINACIGPNN